MIKGKLEKTIVDPYLPSKIVPPDYIREVLHEANNDFPSIDFEYELPHKWLDEEYKSKYEELERQMIEVLNWRSHWLGKPDANK